MSEEISKEVKAIADALQDYREKHDDNVMINVSICAFDEESNVIDDRTFTKGYKDTLIIDLEERLKEIRAMKEENI